jgi:hypothetical protein
MQCFYVNVFSLVCFVNILDFIIHSHLNSLETCKVFLKSDSCESFLIKLVLQTVDLALASISRSLSF